MKEFEWMNELMNERKSLNQSGFCGDKLFDTRAHDLSAAGWPDGFVKKVAHNVAQPIFDKIIT
jgi:peptide methionine sulfoxide reductase MsrB